jgi:hypothetical protein
MWKRIRLERHNDDKQSEMGAGEFPDIDDKRPHSSGPKYGITIVGVDGASLQCETKQHHAFGGVFEME